MAGSGVSDIERGFQRLSDEHLAKLYSKYNLNIVWLVTGEGDMAGPVTMPVRVSPGPAPALPEIAPREGAIALLRRVEALLRPAPSGKAATVMAAESSDDYDPKRIVRLPILEGRIAAGPPTAVDEKRIHDWAFCYKAHIPHPGQTTCVRVKGDSMNSDIPDGSLVGVDHAQRDPREIARAKDPFAAVRMEEDCLIRRVKVVKDGFLFEPTNDQPENPSWVWSPSKDSDNPIIGKVVFVYRACR